MFQPGFGVRDSLLSMQSCNAGALIIRKVVWCILCLSYKKEPSEVILNMLADGAYVALALCCLLVLRRARVPLPASLGRWRRERGSTENGTSHSRTAWPEAVAEKPMYVIIPPPLPQHRTKKPQKPQVRQQDRARKRVPRFCVDSVLTSEDKNHRMFMS